MANFLAVFAFVISSREDGSIMSTVPTKVASFVLGFVVTVTVFVFIPVVAAWILSISSCSQCLIHVRYNRCNKTTVLVGSRLDLGLL